MCIVDQKDRLIVVSCGMTLPPATTAAATWLPAIQTETVHQAGVTQRRHMVSISSLPCLAPDLELLYQAMTQKVGALIHHLQGQVEEDR